MVIYLTETFSLTVCLSSNSNIPCACVGTIVLRNGIMHELWIT